MADVLIGEYLYVNWDGDAPYEIVRGHVSDADAIDLVVREGGASDGQPWQAIVHDYARWVPCTTGEYDMIFHLASGPARGAFPVTLLYYD